MKIAVLDELERPFLAGSGRSRLNDGKRPEAVIRA